MQIFITLTAHSARDPMAVKWHPYGRNTIEDYLTHCINFEDE
jgi:hypothetical protein